MSAKIKDLERRIEALHTIYSDNFFTEWIRNKSAVMKSFSEVEAKKLSDINSKKDLYEKVRNNLFIFMTCACNRKDMLNSWCYERCQEVEAAPDGYIDLWARGHYKSTIITFGKTIQDVLQSHGRRPIQEVECCIGIFCYGRAIAKFFLRQIKRELESNEFLKSLYPDILYQDPMKRTENGEAIRWAENTGLVVKRKSNAKEATIEAWAINETQPTSKHFTHLVYDDMLNVDDADKDTVGRQKLIDFWANSLNLGTRNVKIRYLGTKKGEQDTYDYILKKKLAKLRMYNPYVGGDETQEGVLLSREELKALKTANPAVFYREMMQKPLKDNAFSLNIHKLMYHNISEYKNLKMYLVCDSARTVGKKSDFSCFLVLATDKAKNCILIDGVRDRLTLSERWRALYDLFVRYDPIFVYYEKTGAESDLDYFKEKMNEVGHLFSPRIKTLEARIKKHERIDLIEPYLQQNKVYFPQKIIKQNKSGMRYDLVQVIKDDEMIPYPEPDHDDALDVLGYFIDMLNKGIIVPPKTLRYTSLDTMFKAMPNYDK